MKGATVKFVVRSAFVTYCTCAFNTYITNTYIL